jgi:hypothetical protein
LYSPPHTTTNPTTTQGGPVRLLSWGPGKGVLAAVNDTLPYILDETLMQRTLNDGVAVIQLNSDLVKVTHTHDIIEGSIDGGPWAFGSGCTAHACDACDALCWQVEHAEEGTYDIRTKINIKGMAASKRTVAFWNGKQAEVRTLDTPTCTHTYIHSYIHILGRHAPQHAASSPR